MHKQKGKSMKTITVTAHPYADQTGSLEIPDNLTEDEAWNYVEQHWGEIEFSEPELDYLGTSFEIEM